VRWWQPSQDLSSNVTGSSVFDFEGDGAAEAVYADECFLRVYDGATGTVEWSYARSSGTTYENPVIADVDGDFNSEIVSVVNDYAGTLGCPATDPIFAGDACGAGCPEGQACDGAVCRATFATAHGLVVFRDTTDLWVASRPIWNQHAYAVTNVEDTGTVPATSAWAANWTLPGLNNFRQNVQGVLESYGSPDLTGGAGDFGTCGDKRLPLLARACNRGDAPVADGVPITFYLGAPEDGVVLCTAETTVVLDPGECQTVSCVWTAPPGTAVTVTIVADDAGGGAGENTECIESNNRATLEGIPCPDIG
jgi:hypothetical protein